MKLDRLTAEPARRSTGLSHCLSKLCNHFSEYLGNVFSLALAGSNGEQGKISAMVSTPFEPVFQKKGERQYSHVCHHMLNVELKP